MTNSTESAPKLAPRQARRARSIAAGILLTLAVILAPIAVTSVSAGVVLSDTDRFTNTFAPVANDPELQAAVSQALGDSAVNAVANLNPAEALEQYLRETGAPLAVQLSARYLGAFALESLETAARDRIDTFIASETFANLWTGALRTVHRTLMNATGDAADTALVRFDPDGTLWLNSTVLANAAVAYLEPRASTIADLIPTENVADVRLAQDPTFAHVRTAVRSVPLLITIPLVVVGVLVAVGVLLARRRWRALARTAGAASLVMVVFGIVVGGLTLPTASPQQAVVAAFAVPVQGMVSGPAVSVALAVAVAVLIGTAGAVFLRRAAPVDAASPAGDAATADH